MLQIILVIVGLLILVKGSLKVSDTKAVARPMSIYWGLIVIAYGIGVNFLPETLVSGAVFLVSLFVISMIFVAKGEVIAPSEITTKPTETKRNALVLLLLIAAAAVVFYFSIK